MIVTIESRYGKKVRVTRVQRVTLKNVSAGGVTLLELHTVRGIDVYSAKNWNLKEVEQDAEEGRNQPDG